jgi:uncharacterized protein YdbL (DUF1318 family)
MSMISDLQTEEHINKAVNELIQEGFTVERLNGFFLAVTTSMSFVLACLRINNGGQALPQNVINEQIDTFAEYMKLTTENIYESDKFKQMTDNSNIH